MLPDWIANFIMISLAPLAGISIRRSVPLHTPTIHSWMYRDIFRLKILVYISFILASTLISTPRRAGEVKVDLVGFLKYSPFLQQRLPNLFELLTWLKK
jgi:hypothetical protein